MHYLLTNLSIKLSFCVFSLSNSGGGYTMYSREKYPTTATRRNLVEAEDNELYDTDYKYFLMNK